MKIWDCKQNSEQWEQLRLGIPTASEMHRVICPSMGRLYRCTGCGLEYPRARKACAECKAALETIAIVKPSAQADDYSYRLIAQSMMGVSLGQQPNQWMEHGHEVEPEAVREYEFLTGFDTQQVGFCTTDDGLIGASPDRLVGEVGLLEAKGPSPAVHIRHLVTKDLEDDHRVQLQGQLLVTGRQWVDIISYARGFPSIIIRCERDESYISGMNELLVAFVTNLHEMRAALIAEYGDFRKPIVAIPDVLGVSDADVEAILAGRHA